MRGKRVLGSTVLLGCLVQPVQAVTLALLWDYPKPASVQAWRLLVVQTSGTTTHQQTQTVTPMSEAACQTFAGTDYDPAKTWCAQLTCPAPGAYAVLLQADESLPTNVVTFGITKQSPCTLGSYEDLLRPAPLPGLPAPSQPVRPSVPVFSVPQTPARVPDVSTLPPGVEVVSNPPPIPGVGLTPPLPSATLDPAPSLGLTPAIDASMTDLEAQFDALAAAYQAALDQIAQAYAVALTGATTSAQIARARQAYEQARADQQAVYEHFQGEWELLFAEYARRVLAQAAASATTPEALFFVPQPTR